MPHLGEGLKDTRLVKSAVPGLSETYLLLRYSFLFPVGIVIPVHHVLCA